MNNFKKIICGFSLILCYTCCHAQKPKTTHIIFTDTTLLVQKPSSKVYVNSITVTGNKKTKALVVFREMQFKQGDSIPVSSLKSELEQARVQVYNTTLFNEVDFELAATDSVNVNILVRVTERWYWYPVPQFKWVDRNFNEWYKTYKASLERVNYGIKFVNYNLTGRRDQLRLYLINGYSRDISFSYSAPYVNKALTHGFNVGGGYSQKREFSYKTNYNDSLLFYPSDSAGKARNEFVYKNWYINGGFTIRKGLFKKHVFIAGYNYVEVAGEITDNKYNPNYFKDPVSSKSIIDLIYTQQYANVNNGSYPLTGKTYFFSIQKRGLGITGGLNMLGLEAGYTKFFDLGKNWYSSIFVNGKIKLPFDQAYINQRGLGYGEIYLRGLEYYVIDGVATALVKSTIKKKLLAFYVPFPFFPKLFTKIPFTFFAKTYADAGFAYTQKKYTTNLNNRLLYSGGFGIDILTLYDINLRFEYSFNQLGENGLFLHNQSGF
ncbi:MAG: hypothetical protein IPL84_15755 [Chitinophagaceae bacterium]|nr:hypothetical protein [Chitinophagaceae bacterium]